MIKSRVELVTSFFLQFAYPAHISTHIRDVCVFGDFFEPTALILRSDFRCVSRGRDPITHAYRARCLALVRPILTECFSLSLSSSQWLHGRRRRKSQVPAMWSQSCCCHQWTWSQTKSQRRMSPKFFVLGGLQQACSRYVRLFSRGISSQAPGQYSPTIDHIIVAAEQEALEASRVKAFAVRRDGAEVH